MDDGSQNGIMNRCLEEINRDGEINFCCTLPIVKPTIFQDKMKVYDEVDKVVHRVTSLAVTESTFGR